MSADLFWAMVRERERIRARRLLGLPRPWTSDLVMECTPLTNVKRDHDRVTELLRREHYESRRPRVIGPDASPYDAQYAHPSPIALLNAALFRYHGTVSTARAIGWRLSWDDDAAREIVRINELREISGERVFTGAFIIPACGSTAPKREVVAQIVSGIWADRDRILNVGTWRAMTERMSCSWGVGSFMAKEVILDYRIITGWTPDDWQAWTPVGPGARRGAGIVRYGSTSKIGEAEALAVCLELYAQRVDEWPGVLEIDTSDGVYAHATPELDLTDVQFQLCELGKVEKIRRGLGRPKRRFQPTIDDVTCAAPALGAAE